MSENCALESTLGVSKLISGDGDCKLRPLKKKKKQYQKRRRRIIFTLQANFDNVEFIEEATSVLVIKITKA